MSDFWSYWYFHIPNFVLAAVMYTVLGRLVLGFFTAESSSNYIWRGFKFVSDPAVRMGRSITPAVLPHEVVLIFTALWLLAIRVAFVIVLLRLGLAPTLTTGG